MYTNKSKTCICDLSNSYFLRALTTYMLSTFLSYNIYLIKVIANEAIIQTIYNTLASTLMHSFLKKNYNCNVGIYHIC